jgi:hypothetical protein
MEAAVLFIWTELEETIKHWVEDILSCVNQETQGLRWELTKKIDETQVDFQAVKTSLYMWMKSLQETLADTRNDLHKQLSLMLQVKAQTMKAEIRINQERMETEIVATCLNFQTQLKAVEDGKGTGTGVSTAKPSKFDRTTSWAVFQSQFETVAEHNCWMRQEKSTYLITILQGWATDILCGVPIGVTYEETLDALEDCFGDQYFVAAYRS